MLTRYIIFIYLSGVSVLPCCLDTSIAIIAGFSASLGQVCSSDSFYHRYHFWPKQPDLPVAAFRLMRSDLLALLWVIRIHSILQSSVHLTLLIGYGFFVLSCHISFIGDTFDNDDSCAIVQTSHSSLYSCILLFESLSRLYIRQRQRRNSRLSLSTICNYQ